MRLRILWVWKQKENKKGCYSAVLAPVQLLNTDELTVGVTAEEYRHRRQRLAELLPSGSIAILPSSPLIYMAGIIPYPYRPDPDLMYLTGVMQGGVVAVLQTESCSRMDKGGCRS